MKSERIERARRSRCLLYSIGYNSIDSICLLQSRESMMMSV